MIGERLLTWHGSIGTPQAFDNLWHPAPNAPTPGHRRIHDWQTSRSRSIWLWGHLFFSLCIFMLYESQVDVSVESVWGDQQSQWRIDML
jgi:hypothetical protein